MIQKYKSGELEAIELLQKYGLKFELDYSDNGKQNMPDLLLTNGDYIEVTHTNHFLHNDGFYRTPSNDKYFRDNRDLFKGVEVHNYSRNTLDSLKNRIINSNAYELIDIPMTFFDGDDKLENHKLYEQILKNLDSLSDSIKSEYHSDLCELQFLLARYYTFIFDGGHSEEYSERTILSKLKEKQIKKEKYNVENNIDCFIWLFDSEFRVVKSYYDSRKFNGSYKIFIKNLSSLGFNNIYFGRYCFYEQRYSMFEMFCYSYERKELSLIEFDESKN